MAGWSYTVRPFAPKHRRYTVVPSRAQEAKVCFCRQIRPGLVDDGWICKLELLVFLRNDRIASRRPLCHPRAHNVAEMLVEGHVSLSCSSSGRAAPPARRVPRRGGDLALKTSRSVEVPGSAQSRRSRSRSPSTALP